MRRCRAWVRSRPTAAFVVMAFAFSWAAWLPLLAAVLGWIPLRPWSGLHLIGGLGPLRQPSSSWD